ncbi:phage tail family protein [Lactococcus garvieae subsp. garvieae]|uniref:phage tail domain-containing protein n=1 Tax=Lactococcus garvieae TaxID=1363 RepID=UPI0005AAB5FA|nr:phage tail domain-containing protein [Lactococcus garvieae]KAA8718824.1 phage tail family protein [Lactococcus garvieae subsp. garvieae]MDG6191135.1 phage tail family protein [Lactococcus garvieae]PCS00287.1 hypothetical protein RU85_GL000707 [Lactococcus garvieae]QPR48973.1 phage tail family protein [Lactococcus garvieae]
MKDKFYIKIGAQEEVDITSLIPSLEYLGETTFPVFLNQYQQNTGQDGQVWLESQLDKRVINVNFLFNFGTWEDFTLISHSIYRLFAQGQLIRIRSSVEPALVKWVVPTTFEIKPVSEGSHDATFTIPFDHPSGYKVSLYRSDAFFTSNDENLWQFGMGLPLDEKIGYRFTSNRFKVYNPSDVRIDPYVKKHDLKLLLKFKGSQVKIINQTNHSTWSYLQSSNGKDDIILDGIQTSVNGSPASEKTDYGNIILDQGWNDISVTGATEIDLTFSFPFLYV